MLSALKSVSTVTETESIDVVSATRRLSLSTSSSLINGEASNKCRLVFPMNSSNWFRQGPEIIRIALPAVGHQIAGRAMN